MTTYTYPGPDFPGPPSVELTAEDGWQPRHGLGPAMTMERSDDGGAKLEVVVTRLRDWETLDEAAMKIAGALEKLPGYRELVRDADPVSGFDGFRLEAQVRNPAGGGAFLQLIRYALVQQRAGVRDLVQLMGSCTAAQATLVAPEIRAMQDSVVLLAAD
ncbi:hypothetical protein SAMN04489860_2497 [Paraoerskovia marina]|uniref:Lipoprotein LpqN n=1 Tax=Paraoerskovia marina TaxID=545619 RepID=A0A1H1VG25_9CELL|nr:hypothetical protein [Paraoerskovia marina]SDS83738.1 hypothetical protein SAMN04489860_2497 [Paraoerskovia marina]